MPETALLTPETPCPVCGTSIPRRPGRGRPRRYCSAEHAREADNEARAERRDPIDPALLLEESLPGLDRLGDWTTTRGEAMAHARELAGPDASLWDAYVPDEWRTLSRDDVTGVYPGDEVGETSPGIGRVLGSYDRPYGWDRRAE